ncbi:MAG: type VI secretion system contractile sheath large subunit [Pseudomonadota bacterium]
MTIDGATLEDLLSAAEAAETHAPVHDSAALRIETLQKRVRNVAHLRSLLLRLVLDIEDCLNAQLNAIIEAPEFQDLEARWTGLFSVVWSKPDADNIKIKILDLNWDELCRDLYYTSEIRRSKLYTLLGHNELDTLGGEPFGIAMIDHDLSMSVDTEFDDLYTAQLICALAEACMCPILMGAGEELFGESDAAWFTDAQRVKNVLNGEDFRAWQTLRNLPNARFMGLVFPHTQLRGRYEDADIGFRFHQAHSQSVGLWASGCYDFLRTVIAEFHRCAWFGFLKLVSNEPGVGAVLAPTRHPIPDACTRSLRARVRMTRDLALDLSGNGFVVLAESTKNNAPYFVGNRSIADSKGVASREIVTQLQSVMIACRIVHYVKVQIRALIGQVKTAAECEQILNEWFDPYVSPSSASVEVQARFPLQGAKVEVTEAASDKARFQCQIVLRPQYQIDNVVGELQLKTDFGAGKLRGVQ